MTSGVHQIQVRGSPGAIECGFVNTFQPFAVSCPHSPPNSFSDTSSAGARPRRGRDLLCEVSAASAGAARFRFRGGGGASSDSSPAASATGASRKGSIIRRVRSRCNCCFQGV